MNCAKCDTRLNARLSYPLIKSNNGLQSWCYGCSALSARNCEQCGARADNEILQRFRDTETYLCVSGPCQSCWVQEQEQVVVSEDYDEFDDDVENYDDDGDESEYRNGQIRSYSYKPAPIFFGRGPAFFGVELELNFDSETTVHKVTNAVNSDKIRLYVKEDGSVEPGGEFVTHPHSLASHRNLWKKFFEPLKKNEVYVEGNGVGMHVHMGRDWVGDAVRNLALFINAPNNLTFMRDIAGRNLDNCGAVIAKTDRSFTTNSSGVIVYNYRETQDARYQAVNLQNRKTIEVRIFRSTTDSDRVVRNVEFCHAAVEFSRVAKPSEVLGTSAVTMFQEFVAHNSAQYPLLHSGINQKEKGTSVTCLSA